MAECEVCGISGGFLYTCDECRKDYCGDHISTDDHDCQEQSVTSGGAGFEEFFFENDRDEEPSQASAEASTPQDEAIDSPAIEKGSKENQEQSSFFEESSDQGAVETSTREDQPEEGQSQRAAAEKSTDGADWTSVAMWLPGANLFRTSESKEKLASELSRVSAAVESKLRSAVAQLQKVPAGPSLFALVLVVLAVSFVGGYLVASAIGLPLVTDGGFGDSTSPEVVSADELNRTEVEHLVITHINGEREVEGVGSLSYDQGLAAAAEYHSEDMSNNDYTGHVSPDGETFDDRLQRFGIQCNRSGEIILSTYYNRTIGQGDRTTKFTTPDSLASGIVGGWMNSPPHSETILDDSWEEIGIGVALDESNAVYVTANFC